MHAHLNARYADSAWPLGPLTANPIIGKKVIYWRNCPAVFADELRLAAWTMINGRLRPTFLQQHPHRDPPVQPESVQVIRYRAV
jgi:hypothetical protein